jgi:ABC-type dipeptide/oligopeptide/nickel transport system permease component
MATTIRTPARPPRWYLIPVRVGLVTFIVTLLSFAVSLLLGILGTLLAAKVRGSQPDMTFAYLHVALPVAAMVAVIVFVSAVFMEVRHYRQARALAQIERAS